MQSVKYVNISAYAKVKQSKYWTTMQYCDFGVDISKKGLIFI